MIICPIVNIHTSTHTYCENYKEKLLIPIQRQWNPVVHVLLHCHLLVEWLSPSLLSNWASPPPLHHNEAPDFQWCHLSKVTFRQYLMDLQQHSLFIPFLKQVLFLWLLTFFMFFWFLLLCPFGIRVHLNHIVFFLCSFLSLSYKWHGLSCNSYMIYSIYNIYYIHTYNIYITYKL